MGEFVSDSVVMPISLRTSSCGNWMRDDLRGDSNTAVAKRNCCQIELL